MRNSSTRTAENAPPPKTLSPADRAAILSVAATIRAAVLSAAGDDADRIAERVVAHMVAAAVTGVAAVQMSNASESATTATMTTVAIGTPAAMMPPVPVPSPALTEPAPLLLSVPEAAKLLGVSRAAMDKRIQRGQVPGVVRTGRRVQLLREKLVAGLERKAR